MLDVAGIRHHHPQRRIDLLQGEHQRGEIAAVQVTQPDLQQMLRTGAEQPRFPLKLVEKAQDFQRALVEKPAGGGRRNLVALPREQRHAGFRSQLLQAFGQGRLRQVQHLRRLDDDAAFDDGALVSQTFDVHRRILKRAGV